MIKVATWNVNSIRARLERLLAWLEKASPDIVLLQELKVTDEDFPRDEILDAGYHAAVHGQRTWNGVAILSRSAITDVVNGMGDIFEDSEARVIGGRTHDMTVLSVYVPNGKTVGSDKWEYKLEWLDGFVRHVTQAFAPSERLLIGGDFNVAPEDRDVAKPEKWRESVLCYEDGRARLRKLFEWGLVDTIRLHNEGPGPYSWWDYRRLAFPKGDGLRIDHVLVTDVLAGECTGAYVDRDERKGQKPSDHAPVIAEFE